MVEFFKNVFLVTIFIVKLTLKRSCCMFFERHVDRINAFLWEQLAMTDDCLSRRSILISQTIDRRDVGVGKLCGIQRRIFRLNRWITS